MRNPTTPKNGNKPPRGHQARIARELGVSETAVSLTLKGKTKSARIMREHEKLMRSYQEAVRKGGQ